MADDVEHPAHESKTRRPKVEKSLVSKLSEVQVSIRGEIRAARVGSSDAKVSLKSDRVHRRWRGRVRLGSVLHPRFEWEPLASRRILRPLIGVGWA